MVASRPMFSVRHKREVNLGDTGAADVSLDLRFQSTLDAMFRSRDGSLPNLVSGPNR